MEDLEKFCEEAADAMKFVWFDEDNKQFEVSISFLFVSIISDLASICDLVSDSAASDTRDLVIADHTASAFALAAVVAGGLELPVRFVEKPMDDKSLPSCVVSLIVKTGTVYQALKKLMGTDKATYDEMKKLKFIQDDAAFTQEFSEVLSGIITIAHMVTTEFDDGVKLLLEEAKAFNALKASGEAPKRN